MKENKDQFINQFPILDQRPVLRQSHIIYHKKNMEALWGGISK